LKRKELQSYEDMLVLLGFEKDCSGELESKIKWTLWTPKVKDVQQ